jgi:glucokinase
MIIGLDIGGTQIKAAAFSADGRVLARRTAPTEDGGDSETVPRFATNVRSLLAGLEHETGPAAHTGLSAPGLVAGDGRSISHMPGRLRGLENFDWSAWLGRDVPLLNDAHAALLGEVWQGAARGLRDAVLLTLGTGVGGAIWADGRLLRGHIGRAGHIGHLSLDPFGAPTITGTPGGLENWIGNHNIAERSGGRFTSTHELVAAYETGDTFAAEVWLRSIRGLGCAIASLVNVLDPEAVVIGGGIASAGRALFDPLSRVLDETEWRPAGHTASVLPAQLGEWAGTYGAAWNATHAERRESRPTLHG